jgi:glutamyl-Q tRNA(Asp) synthetase
MELAQKNARQSLEQENLRPSRGVEQRRLALEELQQALGLPTPQYLHTPLVLGANGEKLSKQNGAVALDLSEPLSALEQAALALGLPAPPSQHNFLTQAQTNWTRLFISRA